MEQVLTQEQSNAAKDRIQKKVINKFYALPRRFGAAYLATGTGKSKIFVDIAHDLITARQATGTPFRILLVVPTEKLRDKGWKNEFEKWHPGDWVHIERVCYASLRNMKGGHYDLVGLDEGHNITDNNSQFFEVNYVGACLLLTGTRPKKGIKKDIIEDLGFTTLLVVTLDQAEKLGLVAPHKLICIGMHLDDKNKYLLAGKKGKQFLQTEKNYYNYISYRIFNAPSKFNFISRMHFLKSLKSKTEIAKLILENVIPKDKRTLIFCGSIEQAIELCDRRYFSKPTLLKKDQKIPEKVERVKRILENYEGDKGLDDFNAGLINVLSCVEALNEGHNIDNLDIGYVVQLNSNEKDLMQRIGRVVRFRIGHTAYIIILYVIDTVDEEWTMKAISGIDPSKITWYELGKLRTGEQKIVFN